MLEKPPRMTLRTGQTATVAVAAMVVAPGLMWCIAVIGYLYYLRRGLGECFVDS